MFCTYKSTKFAFEKNENKSPLGLGRTYDLVYLICHIESFKMPYDTIAPKLHNCFNAAKYFLSFLRNLRLAFGLAKWLYMLKLNHFKAL